MIINLLSCFGHFHQIYTPMKIRVESAKYQKNNNARQPKLLQLKNELMMHTVE